MLLLSTPCEFIWQSVVLINVIVLHLVRGSGCGLCTEWLANGFSYVGGYNAAEPKAWAI